MFQRCIFYARFKGKERHLQSCKPLTTIESYLGRLAQPTHVFVHICLSRDAGANKGLRGPESWKARQQKGLAGGNRHAPAV